MSPRPVNPFVGLEAFVRENHSLKRHTWYRIGGPARYYITPDSVETLANASRRCNDHQVQTFVLGLGANLLVRDEGVDGAVFRLDAPSFETVRFEGPLVHVGAGVDLQKLIVQTVRQGLGGIEVLAGIPGTIGGALRMNAGGKYGDIGPLVERVTTMDASGVITERTRDDIVFAYRTSDLTDRFIIGATLRLEPGDPNELVTRYKEVWMYKRNTQPLNSRNSGCIFKNPGGPTSAGALIDQAGLKGLRVGRAEVSDKHANFIVAQPDCPSGDVLKLIKLVQERVFDHAGVELRTEVKLWPEQRAD
jgi:UDP-N-acetylmuramate dehydrogenase